MTPVEIEGVRINLPSLGASVREALARAGRGQGFALFTLNLDHLVKLRNDPGFVRAYAQADLVSADGAPVVWLARREDASVERAAGADMVEPLCGGAAKAGLGVYVVGPGPAAQAAAIDTLKSRYVGLNIAGAETPMVPADLSAFDVAGLAGRINATGARLCFLCLGAPKQELLAAALKPLCPSVGFLCVGAALDFISSEAVRAPGWMQRSGLEWVWRLVGDPRRLGARYAQCAVLFSGLAVRALLRPAPRRADPALEAVR